MARELWVTLLDNDNGSIAGRAAKVLQKPRKKIVPTFDVKTHPGSFQIETRQITFQKLSDIQANYEAIFGPVATHLFNVEASYIHILYAFRNVLVHKRGKADKTFRDQVSSYPEFDTIKDGDQIAPDGETVRKIRDAAMVLGRKLVETADAELLRQSALKDP